jgi:hypothetical protein
MELDRHWLAGAVPKLLSSAQSVSDALTYRLKTFRRALAIGCTIHSGPRLHEVSLRSSQCPAIGYIPGVGTIRCEYAPRLARLARCGESCQVRLRHLEQERDVWALPISRLNVL